MLPTGCRALDVLLGGGLPAGIITQLYGPAGSGKSAICLQAAHTAARAGRRVAFVDTEGSFHLRRLEQICGPALKKVLQSTILLEAHSFAQQSAAIAKAAAARADLIIVDSLTSLYRVERTDDTAAAVNRELGRQLATLLAAARRQGIPVLVTNQVYTDIDTNSVEPVGGDVLRYATKVIAELRRAADGSRTAILRKHAFRKEGTTARFRIVERGLADAEG